jgi:hypothetical protein
VPPKGYYEVGLLDANDNVHKEGMIGHPDNLRPHEQMLSRGVYGWYKVTPTLVEFCKRVQYSVFAEIALRHKDACKEDMSPLNQEAAELREAELALFERKRKMEDARANVHARVAGALRAAAEAEGA